MTEATGAELTAGSPPQPIVLEGRYCRLEPLTPRHAPDFYAAVSGDGMDARYRYLPSSPPHSEQALAASIDKIEQNGDQLYFAVIENQTQKCLGQQAFLRIRPEHRSVEVGSVLWGRGLAGTRIATDALYTMAQYVFDDLGYFRFEWKCNNLNLASKRAAIRFGFKFEGIFRKDMIVKNQHRDTAWFSILTQEWPDLKTRFNAWLDPANFDADGHEIEKLATPRL